MFAIFFYFFASGVNIGVLGLEDGLLDDFRNKILLLTLLISIFAATFRF